MTHCSREPARGYTSPRQERRTGRWLGQRWLPANKLARELEKQIRARRAQRFFRIKGTLDRRRARCYTMFATVAVAQPGRAPDCGSGCRGFKSRRSPHPFVYLRDAKACMFMHTFFGRPHSTDITLDFRPVANNDFRNTGTATLTGQVGQMTGSQSGNKLLAPVRKRVSWNGRLRHAAHNVSLFP